MSRKLVAATSALINASPDKVWDALTNPDQIRKYFFGTEAVSDWKKGSPLEFRGEWEGKPYRDKGTILETDAPRLFQYDYISSMSGLEDVPENYAVITYRLSPEGDGTRLEITQTNIDTEERRAHSEQNWNYLLAEIAKLIA